jgi:hypothetical protein
MCVDRSLCFQQHVSVCNHRLVFETPTLVTEWVCYTCIQEVFSSSLGPDVDYPGASPGFSRSTGQLPRYEYLDWDMTDTFQILSSSFFTSHRLDRRRII